MKASRRSTGSLEADTSFWYLGKLFKGIPLNALNEPVCTYNKSNQLRGEPNEKSQSFSGNYGAIHFHVSSYGIG
jgi:hypothetical protein